ncbi:MAG: glycosyltransferase [Chitinophagaceae bacterium]
MTSIPFFSLYIPCYKNVLFLQRLLESIGMQTFRDFELIVTDDSPDNGVEGLVAQFKTENADIALHYHRNQPALGMPQNWNFGLSLCRGQWIKIMHDDDWFSGTDSLKTYRRHADADRSKFIVAAYTNIYEDGKASELKRMSPTQLNRIQKEPLALVSDNVVGPPSVVCVHHSVKESYDSRLRWRVDIDYYISILQQNPTIQYIDQPLVNVGIGALQVTQEVKNVKAVELPEADILWSKYGMASLRSIYVYDGWWRFVRNLRVTLSDNAYFGGKTWPKEIAHTIRWQQKIPSSVLKIGVFSKILMAFSFFALRLYFDKVDAVTNLSLAPSQKAMLSIVIVNYHSAALIADCLARIYQYTSGLTFEIIVVSNSHTKDEQDKNTVLQRFSDVMWLETGYNAGFARANNKGIAVAKGDAILLLNPDTLVQDNVLANTYRQLMQSDNVACGVQLLNEDGSPQISGNYAMKGGLNYLLPLPYMGTCVKWLGEVAKVKKPSDKNISGDKKVDWVNGAFLMVKRAAVDKAGLLDEDFFLYAEEAEWCSRLKKQGDLIVYGSEHVVHLQGETANASFQSEGKGYYNLYDKKGRQIMVSNFVRIRKEFGVFWFLFMLALYTLDIPVFLVGGFVSVLLGNVKVHVYWKNWLGFMCNVAFLYRLMFRIIANRPYFYKV